MRVAVVVPNLNQGNYLAHALDSLFAQNGIDLRAAVLDGGSEDDSVSLIRRYERKLAYWGLGQIGGNQPICHQHQQYLIPMCPFATGRKMLGPKHIEPQLPRHSQRPPPTAARDTAATPTNARRAQSIHREAALHNDLQETMKSGGDTVDRLGTLRSICTGPTPATS